MCRGLGWAERSQRWSCSSLWAGLYTAGRTGVYQSPEPPEPGHRDTATSSHTRCRLVPAWARGGGLGKAPHHFRQVDDARRGDGEGEGVGVHLGVRLHPMAPVQVATSVFQWRARETASLRKEARVTSREARRQ